MIGMMWENRGAISPMFLLYRNTINRKFGIKCICTYGILQNHRTF